MQNKSRFPVRVILLWCLIPIAVLSAASGNPHTDDQQAITLSVQAREQPSGAPALGLFVLPISDSIKTTWRDNGIPIFQKRGLVVSKVLPGSPAHRAGVKPADILVVRSGRKILVNQDQFFEWVASLRIGQTCRATVHRPTSNQRSRIFWKKTRISIEPTAQYEVSEAALRYGYCRVDTRWTELPFFDFSRPSSQTRPFVPPAERYYELPTGSTVAIDQSSRAPRGAMDITQRVISQKRRQWEANLPRLAVGEHGTILGFEVIQILGPHDMIVQVGFKDLGWTLVGVADKQEWLYMTGVETSEFVDGQHMTCDISIAIISTWRYTTVSGASKTIFVAAPVAILQRGLSDADIEELRTWLKSRARP